jgi:Dot/Icm secretion system protein IcmQ
MKKDNRQIPELANAPEVEIGKKLVKILDDLLTTGNWNVSLFLQNASKKLRLIRDETQKLISKSNRSAQKEIEAEIASGDKVKVYVSLYQVEGGSLANWQQTLRSLTDHNVSRPTYLNEQHVKELIRSKAFSDRHGYVVVQIKKSDIYQLEHNPVDTFGHEMLILKEDSINMENILEFIHANKKRYSFKDGKLIYLAEVTE